MKWIFSLLLFISAASFAQVEDSTKYIWYKFQYGSRMPRFWADSVIHVPFGDTTGQRPQRPGALMVYSGDTTLCNWNGIEWSSISGNTKLDSLHIYTATDPDPDTLYSYNNGDSSLAAFIYSTLYKVTHNGNQTSDTIIAKGIRTPVLLPDTVNEGAFEFIILPDMQEAVENNPPALRSMFQYIVDTKESSNIQAVLSVGDITDNANDTEYAMVDSAFDRVDSLLVPNLPVIGNHDYDGGNVVGGVRGTDKWNEWFGIDRFSGLSWYGSQKGATTENYYIRFEVGHYKFLAIALEFFPTNESLQWAQAVIDSNADRSVIICTHGYMNVYGEKATDTSEFGPAAYGLEDDNSGKEMWEKLIRKNKNIFMVFGGHYIKIPYPYGHFKRFTQSGDHGNAIHQIIVNYQQHLTEPYLSGADGFLMKMRIDPTVSRAYISFYSPFLEQYDELIDSFDIDLHPTKVESGISVKDGLYVRGETTLDSNVYVTQIPHSRIVYTKENGQLDSIPYQDANTVLAGPATGSADNPTFRELVAADIPSGSGEYIQNQSTANQSASFRISGTGIIGNNVSSSAKLSVNNGSGGNTLAIGPLLSNSIANTVHCIDTVTSGNIGSLKARLLQIHRDTRMSDDGLSLSDFRSTIIGNVMRPRNNATLNSTHPDQVGAGEMAFSIRQYGGFSGTTTINGPSTAPAAVTASIGTISLANSGGTSRIDAEGFYSSFSSVVNTATRDTIENYIAFNAGSGTHNGVIKNFYHVYMHSDFGQTNWGIYQEGASVNHYIEGRFGLNQNAPTSYIDITGDNGYDQLRLRTPYTPTSSADSNGNIGDISWDDDYIYIKTSAGWKRSALSTF